MKKTTTFARSWNASTQPRKQRLYRYVAPLHVKQTFMQVHLSKELRAKYGMRSLSVRKGDTVKVMRGQFVKKEGKVERVDLKNGKVYVYGIELIKKDGSKLPVAIHPSNLLLVVAEMTDAKRRGKVEKDSGKKEKSVKSEKATKAKPTESKIKK
jgi:large subunit ribosomal protein L24